MMNRTTSRSVMLFAALLLSISGCGLSTSAEDTDLGRQAQSPGPAAPTDADGGGADGGGDKGGETDGGNDKGGETDGGNDKGGETDGGGDEGGETKGGGEEPTENPNVTISGPVITLGLEAEVGGFDTDGRVLFNDSNADIALGPAEIANANASDPFTFEDGSTRTTLCGGILPAHGNCGFSVRFEPTEVGVQTATLTVQLPDNTKATTTYKGTGKPAGTDTHSTDQPPVKAPTGTQTPAP